VTALPDIREPAADLLGALLEGVVLAGRVGLVGVGTPSMRHRSMKCSCDAARSVVVLPIHFRANSAGVILGVSSIAARGG
jgi:hypothetical protein